MRELLREALKHVIVDGAESDIAEKEGHEALEKVAGLIRRKYSEWIHDWQAPLALDLEFRRAVGALKVARAGPLTELVDAATIDKLVNDIAARWESLPRRYVTYFELPSLKALGADHVEIAPGVALVDSSEFVPEAVLKVSGNKLANPNSLDSDKRYLRVESVGFAHLAVTSESAVANAIRTTKCVVQLGEASGCFDLLFWYHADIRQSAPVVDLENGEWIGAATLPSELANQLSKVDFSPDVVMHFGGVFAEPGQPRQGAERRNKIQSLLVGVGLAVQGDGKDTAATSVLNAAEWLFDSRTGFSDAVSYIQASIAFEAAYGGGPEESIMRGLATKVAYSLATTHAERTDLFDRFIKFYGTRSAIAHGRSNRLRGEEVELLGWGQDVLKQLLRKELGLIQTGAGG